jgi:hypothetical protein
VKEIPILFSAAMVRAILAGRKSQTRRIVKPQPLNPYATKDEGIWGDTQPPVTRYFGCPNGLVGDLLWVKENFDYMGTASSPASNTEVSIRYQADSKEAFIPLPSEKWEKCHSWRWPRDKKFRVMPSIFMLREMSRLNLPVLSVRLERLQDISEADAIAEGIEEIPTEFPSVHWDNYMYLKRSSEVYRAFKSPIRSYQSLWESINGEESWKANPWVWAVEFPKVEEKTK